MSQITELSLQEMRRTTGGDWFEKTWGLMLGAALVAGALASGPLLVLAAVAGAALVIIPVN